MQASISPVAFGGSLSHPTAPALIA